MVSHWNLNDSKSPLVFRTLLSILAELNNNVIVSTCPLISSSFSTPCTNPLVSVKRAPITIGIIVTFMFHNFFNSVVRSRYLSFFWLSFNFTLWSAGTAKSTILQVLYSIWLLSGLVVWVRLGDPFVSQNPRRVCAFHLPGQILGCAYSICSYGQISIFCTIPWESSSQPSCVLSYMLSVIVYCIRLLCHWSFRIYHHITYICYHYNYHNYYYYLLLEFFPSTWADGLSPEFGWQQVPSSIQDSSQYSCRSQ